MTTPKTSYTKWIDTEAKRQELANIVDKTTLPFAANLKRDKRTGKQNARQWAMLSEVAEQQLWHGQKLSKEDWKVIFMQALDAETRLVPNLANDGFVALSRSTSSLTVQEHCDLTALIEAFAAQNGIDLKDKREAA